MVFEIPAIKYAMLTVKPRFKFTWSKKIAKLKRQFYEHWLLTSDYEPAGNLDYFEYHDHKSIRTHLPEVKIYFAIKDKVKV